MTDLRKALQAADETLAKRDMPRAVDLRLRQRLGLGESELPARNRHVFWWGALAASMALGLAFFSRSLGDRHPNALGEFQVASKSADFESKVTPEGDLIVVRGAAKLLLKQAGASLQVSAPARLRAMPLALRIHMGTVEVEMTKREPGSAPGQVWVSHGVIEVIGTRFQVKQGELEGAVVLKEGVIVFRDLNDRTRQLRAGESLQWPLPEEKPEDEPSPEIQISDPPPASIDQIKNTPAPEPSPHPTRTPGGSQVERPIDRNEPSAEILAEVATLSDEVERLRAQGRFAEAVKLLERGIEPDLPQASRERFSYELGSILTHQLRDRRKACAHWNKHLTRFPRGRYRQAVTQTQQTLRCVE